MSVIEDKAALRKTAFAARRDAHAAGGRAAAEAARDVFLAASFAEGARVVSGFRPIRTEIDPTPLMEALIARGLTLSVPVIEGKGLPLRFHAWTPESEMIEGPFGAMVPKDGAEVVPDLLIVPLLAFDRAGRRLGYGGGFYDRTLAKLRAAGPVRAIGFAYAGQEVAEVPTDPTDAVIDAIVTETGVVRP